MTCRVVDDPCEGPIAFYTYHLMGRTRLAPYCTKHRPTWATEYDPFDH